MEWRGIICVDDDGSRRRGAAGSRRWMRDQGRVKRGGDVDGRPGKVDTLIPVLMLGERKTAAADSRACACGAR